MQDSSPLVSVFVPSYNHARFITTCIESIVHQTYRNFELIVIDDGSTDSSPEILRGLQKKYEFILIFQKNRGVAATFNRAIREFIRGQYLSACASDDYWAPEKLALQVEQMESHPEWGMCYGKNHFVNDKGFILPGYSGDEKKLRGGDIFEDLMLFRFHPHVNYMIRRSVFDRVGLYDENILTEDFYMNLKIASEYPVGYIDHYLGYYRIPAGRMKIERYALLTSSHQTVLGSYRSHPAYRKALRITSLRNFDTYSGFRGYKMPALKNMLSALGVCYHRRFLVAFLKLLFFFKNPNEH
jgi:alpha-1,3-rhamnosyltransferase